MIDRTWRLLTFTGEDGKSQSSLKHYSAPVPERSSPLGVSRVTAGPLRPGLDFLCADASGPIALSLADTSKMNRLSDAASRRSCGSPDSASALPI
jgi:hypothetical protein